jgi:DivIVA domain-containing protein
MTLSLDDVRNKRFRMARKAGYEVVEVDEFVDEVEESFAQLIEENGTLKRQTESLQEASGGAEAGPGVQSAWREPAQPNTIVVTTGQEASAAVVRLVELSTEQAERLLAEATEDAKRIREEADRAAHQLTTDARTRAERVESEARVTAERLQSEAQARSERLQADLDERRRQLFGDLDADRERLTATVEQLRRFEATYRANLSRHLREQIRAVESNHAEPGDVPEGLDQPAAGASDGQPAAEPAGAVPGQPASDTPRLDALLGDQR